jgi:mannose/fructose/N-acetylgalactosamine-specific phosphotransferase system component IIC
MFATIILLLPMLYFFVASPSFLLVSLNIRPVAVLLRAMFSGYFLALIIAGAIGTIAITVEGRFILALAAGLLTMIAASSRRWFLHQMDAQIRESDAGDANAARQLRRLHWSGMLSNAIQLAVLVTCIPYIAQT